MDIKKLNESLDKLNEGDIIDFTKYRKKEPQEEIEDQDQFTNPEDNMTIEIDSVKCEWCEGPEGAYFQAGATYPYNEFQSKIFEYDWKVWNTADYRGGYDKIKYVANIKINGNPDTYTGRIDLGDGKYGKHLVSIIDNMKEHPQLQNAKFLTKEPPYLAGAYAKKYGTFEQNQQKFLDANKKELPTGTDYGDKNINDVAVGDIFYDSDETYYGQKTYQFFRVTRRTKSSIWVEAIKSQTVTQPVAGKDRVEEQRYFIPGTEVMESRWIDTTKPLRLKQTYSGGFMAVQGSGAYAKIITPWRGTALQEEYISINSLNEKLEKLLEGEVINFADYKNKKENPVQTVQKRQVSAADIGIEDPIEKADEGQYFTKSQLKAKDYTKDPQDVQVGDILTCHWGYSMSIVDYYKVIERKAKSIRLAKLETDLISGGGQTGQCMPSDKIKADQYVDGKLFRIGVKWSKEVVCRINDHSVYYWDGKPGNYDYMD